MEYRILKSSAPDALEQEVNQYLLNGWEPLGAPFFCEVGAVSWIYAQAIVKKENVKYEPYND